MPSWWPSKEITVIEEDYDEQVCTAVATLTPTLLLQTRTQLTRYGFPCCVSLQVRHKVPVTSKNAKPYYNRTRPLPAKLTELNPRWVVGT